VTASEAMETADRKGIVSLARGSLASAAEVVKQGQPSVPVAICTTLVPALAQGGTVRCENSEIDPDA
jgi:hypothetical protein